MINNILELVIKNGEENPTGIALSDKKETYTWGEVLIKVQQYATYLLETGICVANANKPIPVFMNKSALEVCMFWAIAYTGNFYVPLDERMPIDRIEAILETLGAESIIYDLANEETVKSIARPISSRCLDTFSRLNIKTDLIEKAKNRIIDTDPLYTLFTSGSTGVPKGVVCNHRSVLSYSQWVVETFNFDKDTKMGNQTPLYFSMSILDLYSVLRCGGTLFIITKALFMQPIKLLNYINDNQINTIYWVPSALCIISKFKVFDKTEAKTLKTVLFAGEVMPTKQLNYWIEKLPNALFANLFGPTEITDIGIYYIVDRKLSDDEPVPIGKKCSNVDVLVLDDDLNMVKKGEIGELYFRGTFLAMGYYGDSKKTAENYIQNPLNNKYPEIVYKTGDLVRYNEKNEIIYLGRKDSQIKHMGYRIELGEIENAFGSIAGLDRVCCFLDEAEDKIVAIYTTEIDGRSIDYLEIHKKIATKLPKYMIPNVIQHWKDVPLNSNGKINRLEVKERYLKENEE